MFYGLMSEDDVTTSNICSVYKMRTAAPANRQRLMPTKEERRVHVQATFPSLP